MRLDRWLADNTARLAAAGISSARLDCLILLEDITGKNRAWLLAHPEYAINQKTLKTLDLLVSRRLGHTPLAYIRQQTEFFGRTFYVDEHVLEPRPESETMVELLLKLPLPGRPTIVDVGTGSGALAITAKLELPRAAVYAIDIDPACLQVAHHNADSLDADIILRHGDLLDGFDTLAGAIDGVLANLPYVPDNFTINPAAMNEPRGAIFGGPDGLDLYRRMLAQMRAMPSQPRYLLTESLPPQHAVLAGLAAAADYRQLHEQDFIQVFETTGSAPLPA